MNAIRLFESALECLGICTAQRLVVLARRPRAHIGWVEAIAVRVDRKCKNIIGSGESQRRPVKYSQRG
jgi:hypothetical protein